MPGCVASAVGGRAAAPPSRGRGVLLRRLTAAPLRRCAAFARAWCVASAAYRCAAFARAWCVASAAYGCALAGQKGRFPLDFHFVKVSPLSPAARRTSLRRLRRLRFAVFMRCLPGCAASAVGGRVAAPPSRGRGVLLRRLTGARWRDKRGGFPSTFTS
ncbi:hypothetical protein F4555_000362 [Mobiluncus mulieris]|uniref:hypothetical protein n=1 Tax=Mobiluncus mulieris TaxID=2052 RepID=UPI00182C196C|nr:hypothetical protein [Mobiluncus mulieris]MBB5845566.1 hypothetical protein [Mobiluncus mulieris]